MIEEDQEKAEVMADYFGAVFTQEPPLEKEPDPNTESTNQLLTVDFNQKDVLKALSTLNMEKSTGPDELHTKILRHIAQYIVAPLTVIFNISLHQGVPMDWKDTIFTSIHKTVPRQLPSNYRPVSHTSVVVKILERIVKRTIMAFMEANNVINIEQHGFRKGLFCTTNLLIARDFWINALDNENLVDVVYIDFSKAFDKVSPNRLLLKLENLGIPEPLLKWLKDFLVDRR
uniref:Reverse transcriptase domain-containing protein n=1 Tax=Schistosoma curassoni TaxID=6186 RepID=A0A183KS17_9TREM